MIALALACTRALPPAGPTVVKPALRDPERWGAARCNDGTPFGYTIRPGTEPTWIVHLTGGFFCDEERQPCSRRERRLTTTPRPEDGAAVRARGEGMLSPLDPTFARATVVDAHYCSSDLWLGDSTERRATTGSPDGWYFSGRENLRVLVEALTTLHGLDEADPDTRILVLGTSAGGAGVVGNLGAFVVAFPRAAAEQRLKVVLDASWVPAQPSDELLPDAAKWGPVVPGCDEALRARGEDPRRCAYGPIWWPYVERTGVPVLVQLSGLDKTQTPVFGVDSPEEEAAWLARTRASLEPLPWVFSNARAYHVVATDALFDKGPAGRTFRDLLDRFWSGGEPEQIWLGYDEAAVKGATPGR